MSKNFELLQEIGGDEELFFTADSSVDDLPYVEDQPGVSERERDKVFERASLPNPLENLARSAGDIAPVAAELRTPRSATTPIGITDFTTFRPSPGKQGNDRESAPLREDSSAAAGPLSAGPDAAAETEEATDEGIEWRQVDWGGTLRALLTGRKVKQRKLPKADLTVIAREEELKLVQRIFPGLGANAPQVVLFSSLEDDGESPSICARAAEILTSRGDGPVCVVDANFQSPSLHRYFCVENLKGLAEAALETSGIENFVQQIGESNLWLMPSGRAVAQLTFSAITEGLRKRMTELRYAFKYVLIQAGALRLETSEMLLSRWTDGVVLIVEANSTPRDLAMRVKENLQTARVKFLGVVLNNRTFPIPESLFHKFQ